MTWHPWRALRGRPETTVRWQRHPERLGSWCHHTATITVHPDQTQAERRSTITHELVHAELGLHGPCTATEELIVAKESARRLIPIQDLAEAMLFHGEDLPALAEELWVDPDTMKIRLEHLHPAERGYVRRRLSMREESA